MQEVWLDYSEVGLDEIEKANQDLTEWLIEYNAYRHHEVLDYTTPLKYAEVDFSQKCYLCTQPVQALDMNTQL